MNKVYVDVVAEFRKDGCLVPLFFVWEDGRKYTAVFKYKKLDDPSYRHMPAERQAVSE